MKRYPCGGRPVGRRTPVSLAVWFIACLVVVAAPPGRGAAAAPRPGRPSARPSTSAAPYPSAAPAGPEARMRATAVGASGVVYVSVSWKGWVRMPDGQLTSNSGYQVATTCSGFVADPTGVVVTAGHCVDDLTLNGGRDVVLQAAIDDLVEVGRIEASRHDATLRTARATWKVTGSQPGSAPERRIGVYRTVEAAGVGAVTPLPATVLDVLPLGSGDLALVRIRAAGPVPALQIAPAPVADRAEVVTLGFRGSTVDLADANIEAARHAGRISAAAGTVPAVLPANGPAMAGGPVVDLNGDVVATVSVTPGGRAEASTAIVPAAAVTALLVRNGFTGAPGAADLAYRRGLDAYLAGRFRAAVREFDVALAVVPDHALAALYRGNAVSRSRAGGVTSGPTPGQLVGAGVAVLILGTVAAILLGGRRRRRAPAPVPAPPGGPPHRSPRARPARARADRAVVYRGGAAMRALTAQRRRQPGRHRPLPPALRRRRRSTP